MDATNNPRGRRPQADRRASRYGSTASTSPRDGMTPAPILLPTSVRIHPLAASRMPRMQMRDMRVAACSGLQARKAGLVLYPHIDTKTNPFPPKAGMKPMAQLHPPRALGRDMLRRIETAAPPLARRCGPTPRCDTRRPVRRRPEPCRSCGRTADPPAAARLLGRCRTLRRTVPVPLRSLSGRSHLPS